MSEARSACEPHLYVLDLVRFAAALMVAVFHLTWRYGPLSGILPVGWIGVEVFFVLSGFVIAGSAARRDALPFLGHRVLRLYPAAWGCTMLGSAVLAAGGGAQTSVGVNAGLSVDRVLTSLTLIGDSFIASAYWTLPIEIAFYLLIYLRLTRGGFGSPERLAKALIVYSSAYLLVLAAGELGPGFGFGHVPALDLGYGLLNMLLLRHGLYFGFGLLLWEGAQRGHRLGDIGWLALATVGAVIEIASRAFEISQKAAGAHSPFVIAVAGVAFWAAACALIGASKWLTALFPLPVGLRRASRAVGLTTYPLYLLHETVGGSVMGLLLLRGVKPVTGLTIGLLASIGLSIVISSAWEDAVRDRMRALAGRAAAAR